MSNPLDKYLMEKRALGPQGILPGMQRAMGGVGSDALKAMRSGAAQAVGQGVVGAASAGLGIAAMKIYRAVRKREDFKGMMEHNPDLTEFHESNPAQFNAHYNSMRAMVPAYAEDPIISGNIMRTMSLNPQGAGSTLTQMMESRSKTGPSANLEVGPAKFQMRF